MPRHVGRRHSGKADMDWPWAQARRERPWQDRWTLLQFARCADPRQILAVLLMAFELAEKA